MATQKKSAKKAVQKEAQEEVQKEVKAPETSSENDSQRETPEQEKPVEAPESPEPSTKRPALERIIVLLDRDVRSTIASFTNASRSSVVRAVILANVARLSALDRQLTEEQIVEALR